MLTFNTDGMVQQKFPFPAPIMDYIFMNVTAPQLLKLYQTCKFFYDKFNIVEDFEIRGRKTDQRIVGNSLSIYHGNPAFAKLRNLWISKSFTFSDYFRYNDELDLGIFSRMTYDKLYMIGPYFVEEYTFLVKPPTLRHINFDGEVYCSITDKRLSVEECIERIPHVSTIDLSLETETSPLDMSKLISMKRQTKLAGLHLDRISKILDPSQVLEFFMKHGTPDVDYYFDFLNDIDFNADIVQAFYKTIDDGLRAWKLSLQLPPTISSSFIDLTGTTVVITGALDGIGRATVILFRQLGASVIAVARNFFQLKSLNEECQNMPTAGFLNTVSLDTSDDANELFERIFYKFGGMFDILVNIVDTSGWYSIPNIELEHKYSHDLYYILKGHYNLIDEAPLYLNEEKGCIINVSKPDGLITKLEDVDMIAKCEQSIKNFEIELASYGIRINTVNPGPTVLPRPDGMNDADYKKYLQESKKSREEQAAKAIAFLASDAAKLIVGSTVPVL